MTEARKSLSIKIQSLSPGGFWLTAVLAAGLAVLAVSAVACLVVYGSAAWVGWRPVLLAIGTVLLVPVIGLLPLLPVDRAVPVKVAQAAQMAIALRLGMAAVAALVILLLLPGNAAKVAFGVWMVSLYLVSLAMEMAVLAMWLRPGPA